MPTPPAPAWIELDGAHNVRDLGGLPVIGGGRTRPGVLLRSDGLDGLTAADVARLVDGIGLRHVVDLRSGGERAERGRGRLGAAGIRYTEVEVIDDDRLERRRAERTAALAAGGDPARVMADGYAHLLALGSAAFTEAFRRMVDDDGLPALVHCSAGKDRTGVLVALLLDAAGVARDAVVADYAATSERMPAVMARLRTAGHFQQLATELPAFVLAADPATMTWLLSSIDEQWGGAAGWFRAHGVPDDALEAWRRALVAP
jgi:protein tyrosine/serine phosphatase